MNWSRGLLRMWVAFTVLWVGIVGVILYAEYPHAPDPVQSTVSASKGDWVIENPKGAITFDDLQ